jgi:hypothetical protein
MDGESENVPSVPYLLAILERISEADLPANREAILSGEPNATDVGRRL